MLGEEALDTSYVMLSLNTISCCHTPRLPEYIGQSLNQLGISYKLQSTKTHIPAQLASLQWMSKEGQ